MDMDLVPKYADEESSASGVRIDPTQTQNLGVKNGYRHARTADFCPEFPGECQLQRVSVCHCAGSRCRVYRQGVSAYRGR
ncbi:cation efflux system protein [Escherichia coli]|uniref:Cation efflux system protein n=1 Tax=Escherichia coli TaxID=562 RepID=A0A2X1P6A5_ECOLX|nr:cation efflux system protein [Escherichia coli]